MGRQTQDSLAKDINQKVTSFLAEYESLQNLAHFGAELSSDLRIKLKKGERLSAIFDQDFNTTLDETTQLMLIGIVWGNLFEDRKIDEIQTKLMEKCSLLIDICKPERIQSFELLEDLVADLQKQKEEIEKIVC